MRGVGHPRCKRAAQTPDGFPEGQVHKGNQRTENRNYPLRNDEAEIPSLQRDSAALANAVVSEKNQNRLLVLLDMVLL